MELADQSAFGQSFAFDLDLDLHPDSGHVSLAVIRRDIFQVASVYVVAVHGMKGTESYSYSTRSTLHCSLCFSKALVFSMFGDIFSVAEH